MGGKIEIIQETAIIMIGVVSENRNCRESLLNTVAVPYSSSSSGKSVKKMIWAIV